MGWIWDASRGEWAVMATLDPTGWTEHWISPTNPYSHATDPTAHHYYSPVRWKKGSRKKENIGQPGCVWVDLDNHDNETLATIMGRVYKKKIPEPSVLVRTSEHRWQMLWRLDQPLEDGNQCQDLNRWLATELKGDLGSHDQSHVLRQGVGYNPKHDPPWEVTFDWLSDIPVDRDDLVRMVPGRWWGEQESRRQTLHIGEKVKGQHDKRWREAVLTHWGDMPNWVRVNVMMTWDEYVAQGGIRDRSATLWKMLLEMAKAKIPSYDIFAIVWPLPVNKFRNRFHELHQQIDKAYHRVSSQD